MANSAIAKMYGYDSVDDFMNIETTQLLTVPEHQTNLHRDRLKGSRVEADNEHLGQKADGTPFWVRKRTFVIEWDGEPAICSIREDISQAKQSEEALKQSEERFRGAIEGLQEGFALYSPDDKLVMCNDEFRNLHQHCLEYIQPGVSFEAMPGTTPKTGITLTRQAGSKSISKSAWKSTATRKVQSYATTPKVLFASSPKRNYRTAAPLSLKTT
ncbi:MAG: PAS domain-containing protein [Rhodospirillaceae bacterium]|jgi:PAS domain S-box-containing protein